MLVQFKLWFSCVIYLTRLIDILNCQKYEKLQGYVFSTGTKLWSDDDPLSVIQCIVVCKMTENCYAISITYPAGTCAYYNWFYDSSSALSIAYGSENDYIVFVNPISVVYMGNGYSHSFAAAGQFCASIGGRLTTYSELDAVWKDGYDLCGCGWVSDGKSYLSINVPRHGCSSSISLSHCTWFNNWDVFCHID